MDGAWTVNSLLEAVVAEECQTKGRAHRNELLKGANVWWTLDEQNPQTCQT